MKGVLVILDGLGDLPTKLLGDKTPLEAADTPNLDFLANRGEIGYLYTVKPGYVPESNEGITSIFGNDLTSSTRGQLEGRGTDLEIVRGDLVLRTNFATIDNIEAGNIIDRRVGRTLTTKEAEILAKDINKIELPVKFTFKPTVQHRGVLVFKGGFSDNFMGNDKTYFQTNVQETTKVKPCKPLDDDDNSQYSVNILNEFLEKVYEVLKDHPINQIRKEKGMMPANYLIVRDPGSEPPKLKLYKKWMAVAYMPLEIGFAKTSGMKVYSFKYPKLKKYDAYANIHKGLKKACKSSIWNLRWHSGRYDYAYIHIKETDEPGHDNKPLEKKMMLEYIDRTLIAFLRRFAVKKGLKIVVTGDHSTPCRLKNHSADPVPVLFYDGSKPSIPKEKSFNERMARVGSLGRMQGKDLFRKVGFV